MRIGTDIIEIERIQSASIRQSGFAARILSPAEKDIYDTYPPKRQASFLAGRFAAKEAYGKALGTGVGHFLAFNHLSIEPNEAGAPVFQAGPLVDSVKVSISHSRDYAVATVLIEADETTIEEAIEQWKLMTRQS